MAERTDGKRWWETLPAMLTGVAALITAIIAAAAFLNRPGAPSDTTSSNPFTGDRGSTQSSHTGPDHGPSLSLAKVTIEFDNRGAGKKAATPVTVQLMTTGGHVIAQGESRGVEFKSGTRHPLVLEVVRHPRRQAPYKLRVGIQTRRSDVWEFTASAVLVWSTGEITRINFRPARLMQNELSAELPQIGPAQ